MADDTSLFSIVRNIAASTQELINNLGNISKWACQWKMIINPDQTKQAQEVIFSRKLKKPAHPNLTFNNSHVSQTESEKHLGLILDNKLSFNEHLKGVLDKISNAIGLVRKFQSILPRFLLLTIYKTFETISWLWGHNYDQTYNASFDRKLESIQYSPYVVITGTTRGTSYEMLNQDLRLETLESRRWFRKLCLLYNIPSTDRIYDTKNAADVPRMKSRHIFLRTFTLLQQSLNGINQISIYVMQKATLYLESTY